MSAVEVAIRLAAVAVLASYLYFKHRQRVRCHSGPLNPAEWSGKALDATRLKPAVEDVRRHYLAAQHSSRGVCFHRSLLALAQRAVAHFAYFHDKDQD